MCIHRQRLGSGFVISLGHKTIPRTRCSADGSAKGARWVLGIASDSGC